MINFMYKYILPADLPAAKNNPQRAADSIFKIKHRVM